MMAFEGTYYSSECINNKREINEVRKESKYKNIFFRRLEAHEDLEKD